MAAVIKPDYEEVLDLVDEHDQVVGTITHDKVYDTANLHGRCLRAAHIFVINSKGELWIPRRTLHKKLFPGGLDYAVAEHVESGEDYLAAAIRGAEEELSLILTPDQLIFLDKAEPVADVPYFRANYLYYCDDVPNYSKDDYASYEWIDPQVLLERLEKGDVAKAALKYDVATYLRYRAEQPKN